MTHYETMSMIFSYAIVGAVLCIPAGIFLLAVKFVKRCGRGLIPNLLDKR